MQTRARDEIGPGLQGDIPQGFGFFMCLTALACLIPVDAAIFFRGRRRVFAVYIDHNIVWLEEISKITWWHFRCVVQGESASNEWAVDCLASSSAFGVSIEKFRGARLRLGE
jgi:hypothetical protein